MISIVIVIRRREILHVPVLPATVAIFEILTLGRLSRIAAIRGLVRSRVGDLIAMTCFHFRAPLIVVAIQRT